MKEHIFRNNFLLYFNRPELTEKYYHIRKKNLAKRFRIFSLSMLFISLVACCLITSFRLSNDNNFSKTPILILNWITFLFISLNSLLNFLTNNLYVLKWTNYLVFFLSPIVFNYLKIPLLILANNNSSLSNLFLLCEVFGRTFTIGGLVFTFLESLFLNFTSILLVWSLLFNITSENFLETPLYFYLVYTLMLIYLTIFSYFLERIMKFSFAQKYIQGNKLRCLTDAFQKVETGFMLVRANKISFMNMFLKKNIHKFFKRSLNQTLDIESIFFNK
jgi:hypothetical protein